MMAPLGAGVARDDNAVRTADANQLFPLLCFEETATFPRLRCEAARHAYAERIWKSNFYKPLGDT